MKCSAIAILIVKCHLTARLLLQLFPCEIVQESFYNISQTECSAVKIRLSCFDANCTQNTTTLRHQQPINRVAWNNHI